MPGIPGRVDERNETREMLMTRMMGGGAEGRGKGNRGFVCKCAGWQAAG